MPKIINPHAIPDALRNFDSLPDSAGVSIKVVRGLVDCSAATVYRKIRAGTLPSPKRLSRGMARWNVGELRAARKVAA